MSHTKEQRLDAILKLKDSIERLRKANPVLADFIETYNKEVMERIKNPQKRLS